MYHGKYKVSHARGDGLQIFSCDDFDAILDLLEQDEDMEEHFKASVENVSMICFLFD